MHDYEDLIRIFSDCFETLYSTRLVRGGEEPIYLPADGQRLYHELHFAHGFFSSALHECAHWLLAGEKRRGLMDFGYWYIQDGRTQEEQRRFQELEIKPQAMEWILSKAAGFPFHVSIDNLNGEELNVGAFKSGVLAQVLHYCTQGLPQRARCFRNALCAFYAQPERLHIDDFTD